jgi:predicted deacylase
MAVVSVGQVEAKPGELKRGYCFWVELKDGTRVNLPVIIVNGASEGPKIVITSATHPTELVGLAAVQYMTKKYLNPSKMKGSLIIFPVANPLGMQLGEYISPHDIVNLVNAYPGSKSGTITSRIANFIWEVSEDADLVMDFHENVEPCLNFSIVGRGKDPDTDRKAMELAEAFGITIIRSAKETEYRLPGVKPGDKSFTDLLMSKGVPAFTPEFVGATGATFDENETRVQVALRGCLNVLKKLGMIEGRVETQTGIKVMKGNYEVAGMPISNRGGIVHRTAEIAVKLRKDTPIAKIVDVFGEELEVIKMPLDGYIWGWTVGNPATIDRNWTVQTGAPIAFVFKDA